MFHDLRLDFIQKFQALLLCSEDQASPNSGVVIKGHGRGIRSHRNEKYFQQNVGLPTCHQTCPAVQAGPLCLQSTITVHTNAARTSSSISRVIWTVESENSRHRQLHCIRSCTNPLLSSRMCILHAWSIDCWYVYMWRSVQRSPDEVC